MSRRPLGGVARTTQLALGFALVAILSGCVSNRLHGPNYSAKQPAWIAAGEAQSVEPLETRHRLLLIGDAGLYLEDDPTLAALGRWSEEVPSTVLFLGDNIYNEGLQDDDRERGERVLVQQLRATKERKIFVPGNHDWGLSPKELITDAILNQQAVIDSWQESPVEFLPRDGCAGPEARQLVAAAGDERGLAVVLLDPTALIYPRSPAPCSADAETVNARLDTILSEHAGQWVVVASHYPMRTGGPHGGLSYGRLADPIVAYYGWRYGGLGNTYEEPYAAWIAATEEVFVRNPPSIYAAGHDHSLQVIEGGEIVGLHVVSGAGSAGRVSTVTSLEGSYFAHAHSGFVVIDFGTRNGEAAAVLRVIETGEPQPVYERELVH